MKLADESDGSESESDDEGEDDDSKEKDEESNSINVEVKPMPVLNRIHPYPTRMNNTTSCIPTSILSNGYSGISMGTSLANEVGLPTPDVM